MHQLIDGLGPRDLAPFPHPNGPDKIRSFSVLDPLDEVVLRTAAGRVAIAVEESLCRTPGVSVYSSRLTKPPPSWRLHDPVRQDSRRRERARERVEEPNFRGLGLTDVTAYYPSIPIEKLGGVVLGEDADPVAQHVVDRWFRAWHHRGQLVGLPIGPQASGIYGNAYLIPLDRAMAARADEVLRLTDDYWAFVDGLESWEAFLEAFDMVAQALGLVRNEEKTQFIDAPPDAAKLLEDLEDSAEMTEPVGAQRRTSRLDMFYEAVAAHPASARKFKFALGGLGGARDDRAVKELVDQPELLEVAPRSVGNYLSALSETGPERTSLFFERLEQPVTDRTDAVQLHLLRAATKQEWGRAEGTLFGNIAFDPSRRAPTRAWAMEALAKTPSWESESAFGLALTEGRPVVQRAAALSFRYRIDRHSNRTAVHEVGRSLFDFSPTAQWVLSHAC